MLEGLEGDVAREGVLTLTTDAFKAAAQAYFGADLKNSELPKLLGEMKRFHGIVQPTEIILGAVMEVGSNYVTVAIRVRNHWEDGRRCPTQSREMVELSPMDFLRAGIKLNQERPDIVYSPFHMDDKNYMLVTKPGR